MDEKAGSNVVEVGVDLSEFYMSVEWDILEVPAVRQILMDMRRPEDIYDCTQMQPNHKLFRNIYNRLGETGSFRPKSNHGTSKTITVDEEDEILIRLSENPGLPTC
ncbi:hypothetical protein NQ318_012832 [Aromia moschata]|uniref:Uncharacterized protein n=1 Tax=Aromia moschata TaxID=1265417 RepID=A0AAV8XCC3_9CUCU|nr:hypothetical protein NQ318_012832 [Aromia moschata]